METAGVVYAKTSRKVLEKFELVSKLKRVDPAKSMSILNFLTTFKAPCSSNRLCEKAAVWPFQPYVKNLAASIIVARKRLQNENCTTFIKALYSYVVIMQ